MLRAENSCGFQRYRLRRLIERRRHFGGARPAPRVFLKHFQDQRIKRTR
jgi:hypothetical protein